MTHREPLCRYLSVSNALLQTRCLDIWEVGRGVAYALGHAMYVWGRLTRRAALRGDGLSMMSKLA